MTYTIGIDVGGTFTDIVLSDGTNSWRAKAPTDPQEFGRGVLQACELVAAEVGRSRAELLPEVARFGLGTTAVTNVLTVKRGMKVGLLTTAGFEDIVAAAKSRRVASGGWLEVPWQPVERACILGIKERVGRGGVVVEPLDEAQAVQAIDSLVNDSGVEALAVSLLWSFVNPAHERRVCEVARTRHPNIPVFSGTELHPAIREYERTMVAVLNAFCGNALEGIDTLAHTLAEEGLRVPMLLLQANGGTITLDEARRAPLVLNSSGPSAGVVAAAEVAGQSGFADAICGDAGGTSFDVALIGDGLPLRRHRGELHGVITAQSTVDVESIGSAGGSIAWVDERGLLRVGPESARAMPGPACYGRGGTKPTITDALVVLGYIDPASFLRGAMPLDGDAALRACATLSDQLGLDPAEVAWGIRTIAVEEMGKASRLLVTSSGMDPRRLAFVAYGGSGPLFVADIARIVQVPVVLAPLWASVLSAFGAASAEVRRERFVSVSTVFDDLDVEELSATMKALAAEVDDDVARDGVPEGDRTVRFEADVRFVRQASELILQFDGPTFDRDAIHDAFLAHYRTRYGEGAITLGTPIELAAIRAVGIGRLPRAVMPVDLDDVGGARATPTHSRSVMIQSGARQDVDVFDAGELRPGHMFDGPAIVDQGDTTIFVPAEFRATLDPRHTLRLEALQ